MTGSAVWVVDGDTIHVRIGMRLLTGGRHAVRPRESCGPAPVTGSRLELGHGNVASETGGWGRRTR